MFVVTTIGGRSMFTLLEVEDKEKPQKGEHKISEACVNANLESGRFTDMSSKVSKAFGKVYILTSDLEEN